MARALSPTKVAAASMQAAVYTRYGPPEVLEVCTAGIPAPKADEIRVRCSRRQ